MRRLGDSCQHPVPASGLRRVFTNDVCRARQQVQAQIQSDGRKVGSVGGRESVGLGTPQGQGQLKIRTLMNVMFMYEVV